MRRVARQKVGWHYRRPADGDVTHCDVARRLSLLFSLPIGMRITRDGISELQTPAASPRASNFVGAVGVSPGRGVSRKRGVPTGSARSPSDGIGTVGTGEEAGTGVAAVGGAGLGRGTRGGVLARRENSRGALPGSKPYSTAGGAVPAAVAIRRRVRVEMRSEDGLTVWGAREPGEAGADAVGPVASTESAPCVGLPEGVGWATAVAAAGASPEPLPISVGTAITETKSLSAAGKVRPRPAQRSTVATDAETRATKLPEEAERSSILIRGPCVRKSQKSAEVKGSPPQDSAFGAGH